MSFITANSKTAKGCDRSVNYFKISAVSKNLDDASYIIAGEMNNLQLEMFVADNLDIYFFKVGDSGSYRGEKFEVNRDDFFRLIGEYFFHENLNMYNVISDFVIDKRGEKIKMSFIYNPEQQGDIPTSKDAELTPSQFYTGMLLMLENYALKKKYSDLKENFDTLKVVADNLESSANNTWAWVQNIQLDKLLHAVNTLESATKEKRSFDAEHNC